MLVRAAATITPVDENRIGTVGKPIRGVTIRIDSPNAEGVGEVWIRGPVLMKGYYRAPEKTAEVLKDGWFHSGDLGCIDPEGNLSITGRSKDVIVLANGENVITVTAQNAKGGVNTQQKKVVIQ